MSEIWVTALFGILGVVIGSLGAPMLSAALERRRSDIDLVSRALVATELAQTRRWGPSGVPREWFASDETWKAKNEELTSSRVERFIEGQHDARELLADVHSRWGLKNWRPRESWEISEEDAAELRVELLELLACARRPWTLFWPMTFAGAPGDVRDAEPGSKA